MTLRPFAHELSQVRGPVLFPDSPGYAEEAAAWNVATVHRPAVVVGATDAADVAAAVRFAAAHRLKVAVQATGHGAVVSADGCILITTRRMDGVTVDPVTATATVGAGVTWRAVIDAAAPYGLAPLNGSSSGVGVIGYTLGGGLGPMARKYGFAADHVTAVEVVTADGAIRRVDAGSSPDLFWALCGGKGNFGIVTEMEFGLMPVARLYGGGIYYSAEHASAVLHAFRDWSSDLPDDVTTSIALLRVPDLPMLPEPLRGRFVVHLRFAYLGAGSDGARMLAPMRQVAPAIMDLVEEMSYTNVDAIHTDPVDPMPSWERGVVLDELASDTVDRILATAGPQVDIPLVMVELRLLGGAVGRPPARPNAVAGRHGAYSLFVLGPNVPLIADAVRAAGSAVIDAVGKYRADGALVNFLGDATEPQQVRAAWDIKADYDPNNLFTIGHGLVSG
jgi:hypothetical protein